MRAVVIGGGVAGLAAAIALRRIGIDARVYEQSTTFKNAGLGFILLPNGIEALKQLGLGQHLPDFGHLVRRACIRDPDANVLVDREIPEALCATRPDAVSLLLRQLPAETVLPGMTFDDFEWDKSGRIVAVRFTNGERAEGDLFICADGVKSRCRYLLFEDAPHTVAVRIKELLNSATAPEVVQEFGHVFHKFQHPKGGIALGIVSVSSDQVIWYIQFDVSQYYMLSDTPESKRQFALDHVYHWPHPVPLLVDKTNFSTSYVWNTTDRELPEQLYMNNAVLVGDAAHLFLTFSSQGLNAALEDAVELSTCLQTYANNETQLQDAFEEFDRRRRPLLSHYLLGGRKLARSFLLPVDPNLEIPLVK